MANGYVQCTATLIAVLPALCIGTVSAAAGPDDDRGELNVQSEFMYMKVFGNDQVILNIDDVLANGDQDNSPVGLDFEGGFAYRGDATYVKNRWGVGISGWVHSADDDVRSRSVSLDPVTSGSDIAETEFEVVDADTGGFQGDPICQEGDGSTCRFNADGDLDVWALDVYGIRTLAETPESNIQMLFGARIAQLNTELDFTATETNVFGFLNNGSSSFNGKSIHDVVAGPILGFAGHARWGRLSVDGLFTQSVVFGTAELRGSSTTFEHVDTDLLYGPSQRTIKNRDVAIPITEVRIKAMFDITEWLAVGAGVFTSVWWDVDMVPGHIDADDEFPGMRRDTLVFLGGLGAVEVRFFSMPWL